MVWRQARGVVAQRLHHKHGVPLLGRERAEADLEGEAPQRGGIHEARPTSPPWPNLPMGASIRTCATTGAPGSASVAHSADAGLELVTGQGGPRACGAGLSGQLRALFPGRRRGRQPHPLLRTRHTKREELTIRMSLDEGETWPVSRVVFEGPSAYSDLVVLHDGRIGCLFEQGLESAYERITFARLSLEWLTQGGETQPAR
ncbi:MAG: exo-alpha-sialidase [Candidatus Competibacteraceae bacterium]|nr:exo-alpha-sialidase [Candidatus Competibacteraceae bacterium]